MKNSERTNLYGRMKQALRGMGTSLSDARRVQAEYRRRNPNMID